VVVDRQLAGERAAQNLVGSDERAQSLVDLPVEPLLPLLEGLRRSGRVVS
jgi:hypothetical protein